MKYKFCANSIIKNLDIALLIRYSHWYIISAAIYCTYVKRGNLENWNLLADPVHQFLSERYISINNIYYYVTFSTSIIIAFYPIQWEIKSRTSWQLSVKNSEFVARNSSLH